MTIPTSTPTTPENPASEQANQSPAANQTPATPAEAPVTRAEFTALMSKLDKLGTPTHAAAQTPGPTATPAAPQGHSQADLQALAQALGLDKLAPQIELLATTQAAQQLAVKKDQLLSTVLAGVPDSNRETATLAVESLLARSGIDLGKNTDIPALAVQLRNVMVDQHRLLFATQGSMYSAIPAKGDGTYDWSGVNSLSEVSAEMQRVMPGDVYRRLASGSGGGSGASTSRTSDGEVKYRPRNKF